LLLIMVLVQPHGTECFVTVAERLSPAVFVIFNVAATSEEDPDLF